MPRRQPPEPTVEESAPYENFVDEAAAFEHLHPSPKFKPVEPPSHFSIKVKLKTEEQCQSFAKLLKRKLRRDQRIFWFTEGSHFKEENWKFVETVKSKRRTSPSSKANSSDAFYRAHWVGMPAFKQAAINPYMEFEVKFRTKRQFGAFARLVKQPIAPETKSIWFPPMPESDNGTKVWVSRSANVQPRYPIYIISKGRADSRKTSRSLERMNVPYFMVIEKHDYDAYSSVIDKSKILVLPFSNHGDGPGRARNWCWDHAISLGARRHWIFDDNLDSFYRLHENKRIRFGDGSIFRAAEDFVDRYANVPVAGFQYRFFIAPDSKYPPFSMNTRIYSCLLIDTKCKHRFRGRYNEDTDLSLRVLKDGDCTIHFNAFLQGKVATQTLRGGNTDEFYAEEGTTNKSQMLVAMHPDVANIVVRYGRVHHEVDYSSFKDNKLRRVRGRATPTEDPYMLQLVART